MKLSFRFHSALILAAGVIAAGVWPDLAAQTPSALFATPLQALDTPLVTPPDTARARRVTLRADLLEQALLMTASGRAPFVVNLFDDVTLAVDRERLEIDRDGHRSWVGAVADDDASVVSLTWNGAQLVGSVVTNGVAYDLASEAAGTVVVRERLGVASAPELPALVLTARDLLRVDHAVDGTTATSTIDLFVFYTAAARAKAGGAAQIHAAIANAVAVTNTALQRSGVNAEIRAVGSAEAPYTEATLDPLYPVEPIQRDLEAMSPGGFGSAYVEAVRAATGADLVTMLTGRTRASACGVAWLGPSPYAAYSVTEQECLYAGQWSFSHELAHNFGANHAPGDPGTVGLPGYAFGYRFGAIRTLMAYAVSGSPPRLLNYSSATIREPADAGVATGTALQDNARQMSETAASLADYASAIAPPTPADFGATVSGSAVTLSWTPVNTGAGIESFELEYGPTPGSSAYGRMPFMQSPATVPNVAPGTYYVRLRSVGPGGSSAPTADAQVVVPTQCLPPGMPVVMATVNGASGTLNWTASPGSATVSYYLGLGTAPGVDDLGVIAMGNATTFTATPGSGTYYARALAFNACGVAPVSDTITVVIP